MARFALIVLLFTASSSALAWQLPWQEKPPERIDYCRGFLLKSLGAFPVEGLSRTQLWLAWNEVINATSLERERKMDEVDAGKAFFTSNLDSGNIQAILDEADTTCAMGTS
jgi:hypothetical protein